MRKERKQVEAIIFLMGFFDIFSFCLGRRDKGDRGKRENENEWKNVRDFLQIELLGGVCELCILVICFVH